MKDSSLYFPALKASWKLAWQHKALWIFGLFAAFLGQLGMMELIGKVFAVSRRAHMSGFLHTPRGMGTSLFGLLSHLRVEQWVLLIWVAFFFIGGALLLAFAATVSQGAIVHAASQYFKKLHMFPHTSASWHAGVSHFWKLFFLNVIKKGIIGILALWIGIMSVTLVGSGSAFDRLAFVILFALAAFVGLIVSFLVVYAAGYVVVEEYSLWRAIDEAFKLFWNHALVSLEVGLVVLFLNVLLTVVAIAGLFIFFAPSAIAWFIGVMVGSKAIATVGIALGIVLFFLFIMVIGSVFSVFTTSLWTYLFMKMHKHGITSRITEWVRGVL